MNIKDVKEAQEMAIMPIKKGRYFVGCWFVCGSEARDWMGSVFRDRAGDDWTFRYRFRYYSSESKDVFDGKDEKSFYEVMLKGSLAEANVVEKITVMARMLVEKGFNDRLDTVILSTDDDRKIIEKMSKKEWVHMKTYGVDVDQA